MPVDAKVTKASDAFFPMTVLSNSFPTELLNPNQYKKGRCGNGQLTIRRCFSTIGREIALKFLSIVFD